MENAIRLRTPFPDPYQLSANADAFPVLSVQTGTFSKVPTARNVRLEAQFLESVSGNERPTAAGRAPFAPASASSAATRIASFASDAADSPRAAIAPFLSINTARARPLSTLIPRFTRTLSHRSSPRARAACGQSAACARRQCQVSYWPPRETARGRLPSTGARIALGLTRSSRARHCLRQVETARR